MGIDLELIKVTPHIISTDISKNKATIEVYEWISFDWNAEDGKLNNSGMGVHHTITLTNTGKGWMVQKDSYDEGPLTGVHTPDFKPISERPEHKPAQIKSDNENEPLLGIEGEPGHYEYWDRDGAANYANQWVYHGANGSNYENYYNPNFINFNSLGGDCANYVSQSLAIGGDLPMIGLSTHWNGTGAWWYDNNGTPSNTSDDTYTTTWSWTGAHYHRDAMAYNYGTIDNSVTDSDLKKGNPVYYDWQGTGSWYDHVTIVVGTDTSGKPIVNFIIMIIIMFAGITVAVVQNIVLLN